VGTRAPAPVRSQPNQRWSLDFVHDQMASGRRCRVLNETLFLSLAQPGSRLPLAALDHLARITVPEWYRSTSLISGSFRKPLESMT